MAKLRRSLRESGKIEIHGKMAKTEIRVGHSGRNDKILIKETTTKNFRKIKS